MAIMRKPMKNLIKKAYKDKKKEFLSSYDYIHEEVKYALELQVSSYDLHLNINDLEILNEFLRAYTRKIMTQFEKHLNDIDKEHLKLLNDLHFRCNELILESA